MNDGGGFVNPGGAAGFLTAILDAAEDAILAKDRNGTITYWNTAAERLYGYEAGEIVGRSASLLLPPERKGELERILDSVAKGERIERFETTRLTKDGRTIDVSLIVAPIRGADGEIVGATSIARDLTDRSRYAAESQRSERLEVASRLARGIARELVDLVTAIQGHASLVLEDLAEDPRTGRSADAVRRATQRAAEVAHQLLALSGDQVLSPRALDLNQAIAGSIRLLGEVAGRSTTIDLELDPLIADIEVDPEQLDHVLVGLVAASKDRMRSGGRITIGTRPGKAGSGATDVVLTVHDDGTPIPDEEIEFDLRAVPSEQADRRRQPVAVHDPRDPCPVGRLGRGPPADRTGPRSPFASPRPARCPRSRRRARWSRCRVGRSGSWSSTTRTASATSSIAP